MLAPAKLNLALAVGPTRSDGLHELCSLFQPLSLADRILVAPAEEDVVVCPGIEGEDLAARALRLLREAGWARAPVRIEVEKRIPVAAGLGGGSADAACVLRLAGEEVDGIERIAWELGADVPSQLQPRTALVRGAGELVEPLPPPAPFGVVVVPFSGGLATPAVYAEADRLGVGRSGEELGEVDSRLRAATGREGWHPLSIAGLLVNDLEQAAISLRPEIARGLEALREAGAGHAMVTGSGPTAVGICEDLTDADRVQRALPAAYPGSLVAEASR